MSDTHVVERSATIDAPSDEIFGHLIDFHHWPAWSPWEEMDPDMDRTYAGAESGVGSKYSWSGNRKVGQGNMEITAAEENAEIRVALEFVKPFKSTNTTVFSLKPQGAATNVTWSMTTPKTLMTRAMSIFKSMDKMIGPDFEKGLSKLKAVAEGGGS